MDTYRQDMKAVYDLEQNSRLGRAGQRYGTIAGWLVFIAVTTYTTISLASDAKLMQGPSEVIAAQTALGCVFRRSRTAGDDQPVAPPIDGLSERWTRSV